MTPLPIDPHLPDVIARLRDAGALVLVAEPGAGKTTRVPPAIHRSGMLPAEHPNIVMLQPRRVAARAAAQRIADENGWQLGREVGYHIRFDRRLGRDTRIRVLTEGILTRQMIDDPFLDGVGAVLLDEFHERSLNTDLAIALLREITQTVRPDLKIVVMSATLDAQPVARFLDDCPVLQVPGRTFPVQIQYRPGAGSGPATGEHVVDRVVAAVMDVVARQPDGDVLVFLPGADEIRRSMRRLAELDDDLLILPLHGSLPADEQTLALRPSNRRKIVLATNIAETSLTIDGVTIVIDSGLARVPAFDPRRGLDRLELKRISQASATQRAGRSGRTAPGRCIRLWSEKEQHALAEYELPEIRRVDLCPTVLDLHAWGKPDARAFAWYESPREETIVAAERLLFRLGALSDEAGGQITPLGRRLLGLPVHPRLGRLLLATARAGLIDDGADLAALLSEKDIIKTDEPPRQRQTTLQGDSDLLIRLARLDEARRQRFAPTLRESGLDLTAARAAARIADELRRLGKRLAHPSSPSPGTPDFGELSRAGEGRGEGSWATGLHGPHPSPPPEYQGRGQERCDIPRDQQLLRALLLAYPDRVCRRRAGDPAAAVMVGGAGVRLAPESAVRRSEFFLALDARHDPRQKNQEAIVRIASAIDVAWLEELFGQSVRTEKTVEFDQQRQKVVGVKKVGYLDLTIRQDADAAVDAELAWQTLAAALRPRAGELFDKAAEASQLLARLALLRRHMPEHPWPAMDAAELEEALAEACRGKRAAAEVTGGALAAAIAARLPYPLDRLLEQHAPGTIEVPSGNRIRLEYSMNQPPVLAARLQELFGWTDTPRVAGGRVPVLVHLLGPNFRPVQITDDLRSFWSTAYFQVRKDLRVRYPKHSWPEDPLTAKAESKGTRRRS